MTEGERSNPPVFLLRKNLPDDSETPYTVRELCIAAEKSSGYNTIIGSQRIGGLWRVYSKSIEARSQLLLKGIEIRGHTIMPYDKNPFIVKTADGEREIKTTKVVIGNLPLSYSNDDIERKLNQIGCQMHSKIMMERDRDERGGLTRWLTGRRFLYVKIPDSPLPEKIDIGLATASIYHREQKQKPENAMCSRCLTKGHFAATCTRDIVCRTCKKPGHKTGHPSCQMTKDQPENDGMNHEDSSTHDALLPSQTNVTNPSFSSSPSGARPTRRGRSTTQATLSFSSSRSQSREKRRRSPMNRTHSETEGKAARRDEPSIQTPASAQQQEQREDEDLSAT